MENNSYTAYTTYKARELRTLARDQGVSKWYSLSKKELCGALNLEPTKKFSLTNTTTQEVTMWENSCSISKAFKINTGCVFYAIKVGKSLKTSVGLFVVKKFSF